MAGLDKGVESRVAAAPRGSSGGCKEHDGPRECAVLEQQFWRYSLERYARSRVQSLSLGLQDRHGFDVNLMLFCLWLGETERAALDQDGIQTLRRAAAPLNDNLVAPIRSARRWLKGWKGAGDTDEADRTHYEALKAVELRCEQLVQRALIEQFVKKLPVVTAENAQIAAVASLEAYAKLLSADQEATPELHELVARGIDHDGGSAGASLGG